MGNPLLRIAFVALVAWILVQNTSVPRTVKIIAVIASVVFVETVLALPHESVEKAGDKL